MVTNSGHNPNPHGHLSHKMACGVHKLLSYQLPQELPPNPIVMVTSQRHEPCQILSNKGISCLVWFEDAIAHYGVPTVVFDLHLLVADLDEAVFALNAEGWTDKTEPDNRIGHFLDGTPSTSYRRLDPPVLEQDMAGATTTLLLAAKDWNVPTDKLLALSTVGFVSPLCVLVDSLIASLLDAPVDTAVSNHLAVHTAYLYRYCAALKPQDFATQLRLEHRQFHYDALSKPGLGSIPFIREQRQIRDEIRQGKRQPRRNPWYLAPSPGQN